MRIAKTTGKLEREQDKEGEKDGEAEVHDGSPQICVPPPSGGSSRRSANQT